ncbi:MAG TPA: ribonuclease Z, partial [Pirellulales bacterium]|nr:ribonuclease Z [Pirellulales bacterium]
MQLAVLGTAGYHPNESRQTACFMLPEVGVVLDAGTGFFRVGRHLATDELDIFLTHTHLDHVFGLTFLFDVLYGRTMKRVEVHADPAKLAAVQNHLLYELLFPVPLPCG